MVSVAVIRCLQVGPGLVSIPFLIDASTQAATTWPFEAGWFHCIPAFILGVHHLLPHTHF